MIGDPFDQILQRARHGDELAWTVLYDSLSGPLGAYLRARGAPDPFDQLGETFLQLARDLATFTGSETQFRAWAFTIAHHRLIDATRRRGRRPVAVAPPEELRRLSDQLTLADRPPEYGRALYAQGQIEDRELLTRLLAHVTDEQRDVLLLRFVVDLDPATVGEITGRTANAVSAITSRALSTLRALLNRSVSTAGSDSRPDGDPGPR